MYYWECHSTLQCIIGSAIFTLQCIAASRGQLCVRRPNDLTVGRGNSAFGERMVSLLAGANFELGGQKASLLAGANFEHGCKFAWLLAGGNSGLGEQMASLLVEQMASLLAGARSAGGKTA